MMDELSADRSLPTHVRWASSANAEDTLVGLFHQHYGELIRLSRLLVDDRETAEDIVQDAFAGLHRRWRWMRDRDSAPAYLRSAVINRSRDALRHRRVVRRRPVEHEGTLPSAETAAVLAEDHREVIDAVAALPARQRQVITLRYYLDMSEQEIAAALDISRGSVKQHAARAMAALSTTLGGLQ